MHKIMADASGLPLEDQFIESKFRYKEVLYPEKYAKKKWKESLIIKKSWTYNISKSPLMGFGFHRLSCLLLKSLLVAFYRINRPFLSYIKNCLLGFLYWKFWSSKTFFFYLSCCLYLISLILYWFSISFYCWSTFILKILSLAEISGTIPPLFSKASNLTSLT